MLEKEKGHFFISFPEETATNFFSTEVQSGQCSVDSQDGRKEKLEGEKGGGVRGRFLAFKIIHIS